MYVTRISLLDFRNYAETEVSLGPGVTMFLGRNGQGKTNLVEAVGYLATLGSHRVANDGPLVRSGAQRAIVRGEVVHAGRQALIELEVTPGKANRARVNRAPVSRPRDVLGLLRTVLFAPEDLALVKGDPDGRRRFLDELLVARAPRYAGIRQDYDRVLRQRNTLLKTAGASRSGKPSDSQLATLQAWNDQLARLGAELVTGRLALIDALRPRVARAYTQLAGTDTGDRAAQLQYRSSADQDVDPEDAGAAPDPNAEPVGNAGTGGHGDDVARMAEVLLCSLHVKQADELRRGTSLVGPHRDDLLLRLGEFPAKGYASHGESWSFALALRLAAYDLLTEDGGEPVLILDDVFAELDARRRERLATRIADAEQVLVTAAVDEDVPEQLATGRYAMFHVSDGVLDRTGQAEQDQPVGRAELAGTGDDGRESNTAPAVTDTADTGCGDPAGAVGPADGTAAPETTVEREVSG